MRNRMSVPAYRTFLFLMLLVSAFLLVSCHHAGSLHSLSKEDRYNTKYKGHFKVGKEYQIKGASYTPKKYNKYSKVGMASWYGTKREFHGKKTANGDLYNKELLTAAHRTLHMPSLVKVRNMENGKSLIVLVNDRGPYSSSREIDVSEKAAALLGFKKKGTAKVEVEYLHSETKKMLKTFGLTPQEGFTAKRPLANRKCSVNCHVKLVNIKHGFDIGS